MQEYARPVAYIRRSTTSRGDPGDQSKDFQLDTVRRLAGAAAPTLDIVDSDWGKSASTDKTAQRTGFLDMLERIERGEVSHVYAYAPDRLARSVEWSARLVNACRKAGVPITTTAGTVEPNDPGARMLFNMLALVNENALDQIEQKRRSTVTIQRAKGVTLGQKPYGSRPGEDAQAVVDAFKSAGTYHGAARELTRLGIPSRRGHLPNGRAGTEDGERGSMQGWSASTVKRIVMREAPDLVPVDTTGTRGKRATQRWRFSRLLVCPHDGSTLTTIPHANGRPPSYACRIGHRSPTGEHPKPYVISESYILPWAKAEVARKWMDKRPKVTTVTPEGVEHNLTELDGKRERVIEMYAEGVIDKASRDKRLSSLDVQRTDLEAMRRSVLSIDTFIDWDAEPGEVNARLRELWRHVELEYVPADPTTIVIGRNDRNRALDLVPKRADWRLDNIIDELERTMVAHGKAELARLGEVG